ncbi:hypothetical protein BKA81DRAFT_347999 [Phyllosticta paracitricarpa]|uniref:Fe2OG dioxygenase domain-containing protein n=2 Tax=Phyllosticta TaxID=121621 RepID=A0ABR1MJ93_9PEZI
MSSIFELLAQNQPSFQTHQALMVIGLQNDFCSATGKLPVSNPDGLLHRVRKIIPAFRDHAGSIIWVRTEADPAQPAFDGSDDADAVITSVPGKPSSSHDDDGTGMTAAELQPSDLPLPRSHRSRRRPADLLRRVTARNREDEIEAPGDPSLEDELFLANGSGICLAGSHGAAFADDVSSEVRPNDIIVTKRGYSALRGTTLLLTLRTRLITELFVCGCISNISVYATAAEAARHGITIYLIDDCIGYRNLDRHQEAMKQMVEYMGAYLISVDDAMKKITGNSQGEMSDQSTSKDGATADDDHKIGDMLRKLNIKDTPGSASASQHQPAPHGSVYEPILENSSEGRESNPSRVHRSSASTKSHIRMRRRTDTSKSEYSSSSKKQHAKGESSSQAFPAAKLNSAISSSSSSPRTSVPGPPHSPSPRNDRPPDTRDKASFPRSPSPTRRGTKDGERPVKSKTPAALPTLGPTDTIGEGDSHLIQDFLSDKVNAPGTTRPFHEFIFNKLCNEVRFQKMLHATGEVPRLVAVQGDVDRDGSMPIYRHPSDQSLPLLHFSPSVLLLRKHVERLIQHPMNHVLLQFYRQGGDHISEHSDKTLDIVRGSSIVNVSFGAQRTMRLRTKRSENTKSDAETTSNSRETQRIAMPHNSALVIGPATNARWLHGIMPDKRPSTEKVLPETSYKGIRISLTFRRIGTFLSPDSRLIWGQGASSKQKSDAAPVVNGDEKATEGIIRAFSAENQQTNDTFDWDATYGAGFDVLHFTAPPPDHDLPILFLSTNAPGNRAVQLYLQELGMNYSTVNASTPFSDLSAERSLTFHHSPPVLFRDNDTLHTEVSESIGILAYLECFYSRTRRGSSSSPEDKRNAAVSQRYLDLANHLLRVWDHGIQTKWETQTAVGDVSSLLAQLETLVLAETELRERQRGDAPSDEEGKPSCLVGSSISAPDCAVWACYECVRAHDRWNRESFVALEAFWEALRTKFDGSCDGTAESGRSKAGDNGDSEKVLGEDALQATSGAAKGKENEKTDAPSSPSPTRSASAAASASASPDKASRKGKGRRK